jgi:hypothetical protein
LLGDNLKGSKESIMANEGSGYPGLSDEEGCDKEGLFKIVDELCKLKKGGFQLQELLTPTNKTEHGLSLQFFPKLQGHDIDTSKIQEVISKVTVVPSELKQRQGGEDSEGCFIKSALGISRTKTQMLADGKELDAFGVSMSKYGIRYRKPARAWKLKRVRRHLVIGMDVKLEEMYQLSMCALVGKFAYKVKCSLSFTHWMKKVWQPIFGYSSEFLTLSVGWFGLIFKNPKDTEFTLNRF